MRLLLAALCAVSPAGMGVAGAQAAGACDRAFPHAPQGLPTRVLVETQCGTYAIDRDGSVVVAPRHPVDPAPWLVDARQGHLVLIESGRVVWRSRRRFGSQLEGIQSIAVGRRALAFSLDDRRLWISRFRGVEHVAARGEAALGWTAAQELLTAKWRFRPRAPSLGTLFVRREDGRRLRLVARRVVGFTFEDATRTLVYATSNGRIARTDGKHVAQLANLSGKGLTTEELWPRPIGEGLIAFRGRDRLIVLRRGGSLFAESRFSNGAYLTSDPVAGPHGVVFAAGVADGRHETVLLLRLGDRSAKQLYRASAYMDGCRGAAVSWHGDWILYSNTEGHVTALDGSETHVPIDLTDTVAQLPGVERDALSGTLVGFSSAFWA